MTAARRPLLLYWRRFRLIRNLKPFCLGSYSDPGRIDDAELIATTT